MGPRRSRPACHAGDRVWDSQAPHQPLSPPLIPVRRFVCPDTWHDLAGGYETVPVGSEAEVKASLQEFAAGTLEARNLVHVSKHQVEARGR